MTLVNIFTNAPLAPLAGLGYFLDQLDRERLLALYSEQHQRHQKMVAKIAHKPKVYVRSLKYLKWSRRPRTPRELEVEDAQ